MRFRGLKLAQNRQRGFTLVELLVAIAIASVITAGITFAVMQLLTINTRASNHMVAIRQVQQAGKEVSKDALQTQSVNTTGSADFLTLNWIGWAAGNTTGTNHTIIYTLISMPSGGLKRLQRKDYVDSTLNSTTIVAEHIDDTLVTGQARTRCEWDSVKRVLTLTVTATVGTASETRIYQVEPRPSPPSS